MKKVKYIIMTLLVSVVALTGCGKKNSLSPKETFEKTAENMKTIESFKMNATANVGIKAGESELLVKLTLDALADIKNGKMHMNMNMDALGEKMDIEAYADFKNDDNQMIMYVKDEEGNWTKSASEISEDTTNEMDKEVFDALESSKMLKEVKADKENYNYEITVNKETIKTLMDVLDANEELEGIDIDSLEGNIIVKISVDKKTYNLKKVSIDMKDMVEKLMASLGEQAQGMEISKAEFVMTFDYENVGTVEIPSEVIENATEEDEYDFEEEDYFYVSYDYSVNVKDEFSIEIPEVFEEGFMNDDYRVNYEYETDTDEVFNSCEVTFGAVENYDSLSKFSKDFKEGYSLNDGTNKTINNINWEIYTDKDLDKYYYALTEKNEKVYLFEYLIEEDANQETCENYYNQILNSIEAK